MTSARNVINIAHFNDVYQVSNQKLEINGREENIDVTKFATLLSGLKKKWKAEGYGDGLTVFSGDAFSPSIQSSTTRGVHMAPVMNALGVEVSVVGNHEFDFGYPQLSKLIQGTKFPWLLTNITDKTTGQVPEPMCAFHVLEKSGARIGFIGLVEKEWIATITGWPENFEWDDMVEVGIKYSKILRDPAGPHKCDLVFALTHSRIPNDIKLAKSLCALSPSAQARDGGIASKHGVDILLGGHDHIYWVSRGVGVWSGYDVNDAPPDAESDKGDTLIVKSGTDFQDLTEITLTLQDTAPGSVRRKVIETIKGSRHVITGSLASDPEMKNVLERELSSLNKSLAIPICISDMELDARSLVVRTGESAVGNWIADCLKPVYNDVLNRLGHKSVDAVIICTGDVRSDARYSKGPITQGDLMKMLPFMDPMVVVEMTGGALWTAMESGLSRWPIQEGRFPAISGFRVEWRSSGRPGSRLQKIWLQAESMETGPDGKPKIIDKEEITKNSDRTYIVCVGEYMTQGGDGYDVLKEQRLILNGENGQPKSTLIKKLLLGAHFVNTIAQNPDAKPKHLRLHETFNFVSEARKSLGHPKLEIPFIPIRKLSDLSIPALSMPALPHLPGTLFHSSSHLHTPNLSSPFHKVSSTLSTHNILSSFSNSPLLSPGGLLPASGHTSAHNLARHITDSAESGRRLAEGIAHDVSDRAESGRRYAEGIAHDVSDKVESVHTAVRHLAGAVTHAVVASCKWIASTTLYTFALKVAEHEDMSLVDGYERERMGLGVEGTSCTQTKVEGTGSDAKETQQELFMPNYLAVISPAIDGRLKDLDGKA